MRKFLYDNWNKFDSLIVLNGWFEVTNPLANAYAALALCIIFCFFQVGGITVKGVAVLRLLRLLRLLRVVRALPRLRSIVESLVQGFTAVGWVMVLLVIFNYIGRVRHKPSCPLVTAN